METTEFRSCVVPPKSIGKIEHRGLQFARSWRTQAIDGLKKVSWSERFHSQLKYLKFSLASTMKTPSDTLVTSISRSEKSLVRSFFPSLE